MTVNTDTLYRLYGISSFTLVAGALAFAGWLMLQPSTPVMVYTPIETGHLFSCNMPKQSDTLIGDFDWPVYERMQRVAFNVIVEPEEMVDETPRKCNRRRCR